MRQHSPRQQFKEAQQLAIDHGMFVIAKGDRFLLFRKAERPIYLGMRGSVSGLHSFVSRCATTK